MMFLYWPMQGTDNLKKKSDTKPGHICRLETLLSIEHAYIKRLRLAPKCMHFSSN